jgi:hypothetical protein
VPGSPPPSNAASGDEEDGDFNHSRQTLKDEHASAPPPRSQGTLRPVRSSSLTPAHPQR